MFCGGSVVSLERRSASQVVRFGESRRKDGPGNVVPLTAVPDRALVRVRYWRDIDVALLDRSSGGRLGRERKGGDGKDEELREREHGEERRGVVKGENAKAKAKEKR